MKKFLPFLIVIILAVATGTGGYFGYNEYQKNQDEKNGISNGGNNGQSSSGSQQSSSSVPIVTQQSSSGSETSVTDGWTEYIDPDYGFKFKYPNISNLVITEENDGSKAVKMSTDNFSITVYVYTDDTISGGGVALISNSEIYAVGSNEFILPKDFNSIQIGEYSYEELGLVYEKYENNPTMLAKYKSPFKLNSLNYRIILEKTGNYDAINTKNIVKDFLDSFQFK